MPDYVYALHDFVPENEDEVPFRAGERIEVVEKDDLYGDGWWQGRNLSGKTGLFPQSYTTPAVPNSPSPARTLSSPAASSSASVAETSQSVVKSPTLQALEEESDSASAKGKSTTNGLHERTPSQGGEVMQATMTDVQKAIEQLGRNDRDGTRSFSFASTRGESESEADLETDKETDAEDGEGVGWHKDARQRLADEARKANERAAAAAAALTDVRISAPPIEVELSDESDEEDGDETAQAARLRRHSHITEEEEEEGGTGFSTILANANASEPSASPLPSHELYVPHSEEEMDVQTATARRSSFPTIYPPVKPSPSFESIAPPTPTTPSTSASLPSHDTVSSQLSAQKMVPTSSTATVTASATVRDVAAALPSPAASSIGGPQITTVVVTPASANTSHTGAPELAPTEEAPKKSSVHPSEWTVEDVIEWLKSKGFDQGVCDKFIEQEITGDVLLELDANLLKSEIGIAAFGKRVRIANAITELRRPPSIVYSDHQPSHILTQSSPSLQQLPQPYSPHSQTYSHSHSHSVQSSAQSIGRSPTTPATAGTMNTSAGFSSLMSAESAPHTGDMTSPSSDLKQSIQGFEHMITDSDGGTRSSISLQLSDVDPNLTQIGLGLKVPGASNGTVTSTNGKASKSRPSQLMLSPSDSALTAKTGARAVSVDHLPDSREDERTAMSESETTQNFEAKSKRRRMFGRSSDSSHIREKDHDSQGRHSKEATTPISNTSKSGEEGSVTSRHTKAKRSVDASKSSDRLSLFGGHFGGTLGKSRKPPPRYSTYGDNADLPSEKSQSHLSLSKIYGGSKRSVRPSTADGSAHQSLKEKSKASLKEGEKRPERLRKRTISTSERASEPGSPRAIAVSHLKPGQSILEQIGTPDHNGWMRKKGDRYNTWKLRYFVLKGPHLYYLRSNNKTETKIKGYINIVGYKVIADENVDPGRYGFKITHDQDKSHFFSSEEQLVIREWMKALMKATIGRDYTRPVVSSCNVPTIPLTVAQAMNPAPRPPSPGARAATQKALRRENPNQLSSRDAQILMGLPSPGGTVVKDSDRVRLESFFTNEMVSSSGQELENIVPSPKSAVPPRPSREMRRTSNAPSVQSQSRGDVDPNLIEWANSHLPKNLKIIDTTGSICGGLALLRLAESIKGKPSSPPVPDSAFPSSPNDDKLDGLFRLFDILLDNDVKMGTVSINDVRQGKREKIIQLLKALKTWEDKRKAISLSMGSPTMPPGAFMTPGGALPWGSL